LYPFYSELTTLLNDMSPHLEHREERAGVHIRSLPAFHPPLLVINEGKSFIGLEKVDNPRRVKDIGMKRTGTTRSTKYICKELTVDYE
jgi:hypothetical protein